MTPRKPKYPVTIQNTDTQIIHQIQQDFKSPHRRKLHRKHAPQWIGRDPSTTHNLNDNILQPDSPPTSISSFSDGDECLSDSSDSRYEQRSLEVSRLLSSLDELDRRFDEFVPDGQRPAYDLKEKLSDDAVSQVVGEGDGSREEVKLWEDAREREVGNCGDEYGTFPRMEDDRFARGVLNAWLWGMIVLLAVVGGMGQLREGLV